MQDQCRVDEDVKEKKKDDAQYETYIPLPWKNRGGKFMSREGQESNGFALASSRMRANRV